MGLIERLLNETDDKTWTCKRDSEIGWDVRNEVSSYGKTSGKEV